jgi:hypothetical protein
MLHQCNRGRLLVCDLWRFSGVKTSAVLSVVILLIFSHFSDILTGLFNTFKLSLIRSYIVVPSNLHTTNFSLYYDLFLFSFVYIFDVFSPLFSVFFTTSESWSQYIDENIPRSCWFYCSGTLFNYMAFNIERT